MNVDGYLSNTLKTPVSYETTSMTYDFFKNRIGESEKEEGEKFKRNQPPWMKTNNFYYKEKLQKPKDHSNEYISKYSSINLLTIIRS